MRVWIYRPDKKPLELDKDLLYYKGITANEYEKTKKEDKSTKPTKFTKPHFVEVPHDR